MELLIDFLNHDFQNWNNLIRCGPHPIRRPAVRDEVANHRPNVLVRVLRESASWRHGGRECTRRLPLPSMEAGRTRNATFQCWNAATPPSSNVRRYSPGSACRLRACNLGISITGEKCVTQTNFPLNVWYVAAWDHEAGHKLLGRKVCGEKMVPYSTLAGHVVALSDPGWRRPIQLSRITRLIGDDVQCGYASQAESIVTHSESSCPLNVVATRELDPGTRELLLATLGVPTAYGCSAHIQVLLTLPDGNTDVRHSSLIVLTPICGRLRIAVKEEAARRGGSACMWRLFEGARVRVSEPQSPFNMSHGAHERLLKTGGIDIRPVVGVALFPQGPGLQFRLVCFGRAGTRRHRVGVGLHARRMRRVLGEAACLIEDSMGPDPFVTMQTQLGYSQASG